VKTLLPKFIAIYSWGIGSSVTLSMNPCVLTVSVTA